MISVDDMKWFIERGYYLWIETDSFLNLEGEFIVKNSKDSDVKKRFYFEIDEDGSSISNAMKNAKKFVEWMKSEPEYV